MFTICLLCYYVNSVIQSSYSCDVTTCIWCRYLLVAIDGKGFLYLVHMGMALVFKKNFCHRRRDFVVTLGYTKVRIQGAEGTKGLCVPLFILLASPLMTNIKENNSDTDKQTTNWWDPGARQVPLANGATSSSAIDNNNSNNNSATHRVQRIMMTSDAHILTPK